MPQNNNIILACMALCILHFMSTAALASDCSQSVSLLQKSKYRAEAGFTPVDNSITETYAELSCSHFDAYVWGVHNNDSGKFNEVDLGLAHNIKFDSMTLRLVYERWEYPEGTGNNDVFLGILVYRGWPLVTKLKWTYVTEDSGQLTTLILNRPFALGKLAQANINLNPSIRINCVDDYFGATECPSNIVYGIKLVARQKQFFYGLLFDYHDGRGQFDDTNNVGLQIGYDFK